MNDINDTLKEAYNATSVIVMPGSGSFGMEAVARQWATGKKVSSPILATVTNQYSRLKTQD